MENIISLIVDIVGTPAFLVSIISLIGLLAQKKNGAEIISGTIKTFVGFLVLQAGSGVIGSSMEPFGGMFKAAFNVRGVLPNNEAIVALLIEDYGGIAAIIMFLGMLVNIAIARFTALKYIYLTGHHTLYMALLLVIIFQVSGFQGASLFIFSGLALGALMSLAPFVTGKYMKDVTGDSKVGMGHFNSLGYVLAAKVAEPFGKNKENMVSTEDIKFPQSLGFLKDSIVAIALTMSIIYIILAVITRPEFIRENYNVAENYIVYMLLISGKFSAGVYIILQGVRMILNEIIPAFKGISEKMVPNSIPSLDCPVVFPYASNAVLIGFFSSFFGGVISMLIMGLLGMVIIIPGVVPHFFCGAAAGVFANSKGGLKGAVVGSFVHGIFISFLPAFLVIMLGELLTASSIFSDSDFSVYGLYFGKLGENFGKYGIIGGIVIIYAFIIVYTIIQRKNEKKSA